MSGLSDEFGFFSFSAPQRILYCLTLHTAARNNVVRRTDGCRLSCPARAAARLTLNTGSSTSRRPQTIMGYELAKFARHREPPQDAQIGKPRAKSDPRNITIGQSGRNEPRANSVTQDHHPNQGRGGPSQAAFTHAPHR